MSVSFFNTDKLGKYFVKTAHDTLLFVDINSNRLIHKKCSKSNIFLVLDERKGALYIPDKCAYVSSLSMEGELEYSTRIKYFDIIISDGQFSVKIGDWFLCATTNNNITFSQQKLEWETFEIIYPYGDVEYHLAEMINQCDMSVYSIRTCHQTIGYVNGNHFLVHANETIDADSMFKIYIVKSALYAYLCILKDKTIFYIKDVDQEGRATLSLCPYYITCSKNIDDTVSLIINQKYIAAHGLGRLLLAEQDMKWGHFYLEEDGGQFAALVGNEESSDEVGIEVNMLNMVDTLSHIKENRCSIARFGDGEFRCMLRLGDMQNYQKFGNKLAYMLLAALNSSSDKMLICLPGIIKNPHGWWKQELSGYRSDLEKIIPKNCIFGDAFVSRFYDANEFKKNKECLTVVSLWKEIFHKRRICIVEGEYSRVGVGNDLLDGAASVERILAPAMNAFEKFENILDVICRKVSKDSLLLLALGQTASVMAPFLAHTGYQALDIGHLDIIYEWYLKGVTEKTQVKGKWVNEAGGMSDASFPSLKDEKRYLSEIIHVVN